MKSTYGDARFMKSTYGEYRHVACYDMLALCVAEHAHAAIVDPSELVGVGSGQARVHIGLRHHRVPMQYQQCSLQTHAQLVYHPSSGLLASDGVGILDQLMDWRDDMGVVS